MKKKLAIISTHPVQYYAPLFKQLNSRGFVGVKVFYTWGEAARKKVFDPGFGKSREWDIPLLDGYEFEFVRNISTNPGSHHFSGIKNPELVNILHQYNPDAILVFGWNFHSHLKVLRHFKGKIPVFFRGDSTLLNEKKGFSFKKIARRIFLRWVYTHIDYALYVGTNNKAYYVANGVSPSQLIYAPHAIDNDRFSENENKYRLEADEWLEKLKIPARKPVALFAGKLDHNKNVLLMAEAAKAISELSFIIIGNGLLENEIEQAAAQTRNLFYLPFQNQSKMPVIYRLCDVFVLPSKLETWGLALNEAMACGCAVIATTGCGGAIDLIEEGKNGFVIAPDLSSLKEALKKCGFNKQNYFLMKQFSVKKIKKFSYDKICYAIESLMANL